MKGEGERKKERKRKVWDQKIKIFFQGQKKRKDLRLGGSLGSVTTSFLQPFAPEKPLLSLSLSLSLSCCHADCSARERRTRRTRSVLHPRYVVVRERIEPTRGVGSRSSKIGGRRAKRAYASEWLHVVTGLSLVHSSFLWVQRRASIVSRRLLVETK